MISSLGSAVSSASLSSNNVTILAVMRFRLRVLGSRFTVDIEEIDVFFFLVGFPLIVSFSRKFIRLAPGLSLAVESILVPTR